MSTYRKNIKLAMHFLGKVGKVGKKLEEKEQTLIKVLQLVPSTENVENDWDILYEDIVKFFHAFLEYFDEYAYLKGEYVDDMNKVEEYFRIMNEYCIDGYNNIKLMSTLCPLLMRKIGDSKLPVWYKKLILKCLNQCFMKIPNHKKLGMLLNIKKELIIMVSAVLELGDYEAQTTVCEVAWRIGGKAIQKLPLFSDNTELSNLFKQIDSKSFDLSMRRFLSVVNDNRASVFSLPCNQVFLGSRQIEKPKNMDRYWIDFNMMSRTISWYCNRDSLRVEPPSSESEDMVAVWEMLSFYVNDVTSITSRSLYEPSSTAPIGTFVLFHINKPLQCLTDISKEIADKRTVSISFLNSEKLKILESKVLVYFFPNLFVKPEPQAREPMEIKVSLTEPYSIKRAMKTSTTEIVSELDSTRKTTGVAQSEAIYASKNQAEYETVHDAGYKVRNKAIHVGEYEADNETLFDVEFEAENKTVHDAGYEVQNKTIHVTENEADNETVFNLEFEAENKTVHDAEYEAQNKLNHVAEYEAEIKNTYDIEFEAENETAQNAENKVQYKTIHVAENETVLKATFEAEKKKVIKAGCTASNKAPKCEMDIELMPTQKQYFDANDCYDSDATTVHLSVPEKTSICVANIRMTASPEVKRSLPRRQVEIASECITISDCDSTAKKLVTPARKKGRPKKGEQRPSTKPILVASTPKARRCKSKRTDSCNSSDLEWVPNPKKKSLESSRRAGRSRKKRVSDDNSDTDCDYSNEPWAQRFLKPKTGKNLKLGTSFSKEKNQTKGKRGRKPKGVPIASEDSDGATSFLNNLAVLPKKSTNCEAKQSQREDESDITQFEQPQTSTVSRGNQKSKRAKKLYDNLVLMNKYQNSFIKAAAALAMDMFSELSPEEWMQDAKKYLTDLSNE